MADNAPYGFWTFDGQNALYGAESTTETLADGRIVVHKDPDYPAVVEDEFILYALRTSRQARSDFDRILPTMDVVSKRRLTELVEKYPIALQIFTDDQAVSDEIQRRATRQGVRVGLPRPRL